MRILVNGATGLIGSAVCARLFADGHEVVAAMRKQGPKPISGASCVVIDMASADTADWTRHLRDVDAVVNCAGTFQDGPRESTAATHSTGADVLFGACEQLGIRRVIHFSAIGVDREQPSNFSSTKYQGDKMLKARDLDWVILRPSVVLGRGAFGGSALFRGLAALPVVPLMSGTGLLQVVQLDDITETVPNWFVHLRPNRSNSNLPLPRPFRWKKSSRTIEPGWAGSLRGAGLCQDGCNQCSLASVISPAGWGGDRHFAARRQKRSGAGREAIPNHGANSPESGLSPCLAR